jgi:hypothetical protein
MTYKKLSRISKVNFLAKVVEVVKVAEARNSSMRKDIHLLINKDSWILKWISLEGFTYLPASKKHFESLIDNRLKKAIREEYIQIDKNRSYTLTQNGEKWIANFDYDY